MISAVAARPATAAVLTWNNGGTGTWDISTTNWSAWSGVSGGPWDSTNGTGSIADFNTASAAASVSGTVYANGLQFDNTANIASGTINLVTAGGSTFATPTITVNASGGTIGSVLGGSAGLATAGNGRLVLTGANSYSGGTTIGGGTLQVGNGGSTGSLGSGNIVNNGNLVYALNSANVSLPTSATYSGAGNLSVTGNIVTFAGNLAVGGAFNYNGVSVNNAGTAGASSVVTATSASLTGYVWGLNSAAGTLQVNTSASNGAIAINGITSGYAGKWYSFNNLDFNAGTGPITISGANAFSWWNGGATIKFDGQVSGSGNISYGNNASGVATLTFNNPGASTYSGVINSANFNFVKAGAGAQTLSGSNTYTGTTTVSAGTLVIGGGGVLGNGSYAAAISNSGALVFNSSSNQTFSGAITGAGGSLWQAGPGLLTITGTNNSGGGTTIGGGTLQIGNGSVNGTIGSSTYSIAASSAMLRLNYATASAPTWANISGSGTLSLKTALAGDTGWGTAPRLPATFTGTLQIESGRLYASGQALASTNFGNAAAIVILPGGQLGMDTLTSLPQNLTIGGTGYGGGANDGALRVGVAANLSGSVTLASAAAISVDSGKSPTFSGTISGGSAANVTIGGGSAETGTAVFANANTYSGNTTVTYGTLKLSNSAALQNSTLTTAGISFDPNASSHAFTFGGLSGAGNISLNDGTNAVALSAGNNGVNTTYSGVLSNNGSLTKIGGGELTFTGANSYTGLTTVNGGTLQIGSGAAAGSLALSSSITTNATLAFARSDAIAQGTQFSASPIGGTGGLVQLGPGTLTLNAANTYSGGTTIAAGSLVLGATATLGSGNVTINPGALLDVSAWGGGGYSINSGLLTAGRAASPATDINGTLNVSNATVSPYTGGSGTMTVAGGLSLSGGSVSYDQGDLIALGGGNGLTLGGVNDIVPNNTVANGTYTLFTYSSLSGGTNNLAAVGPFGSSPRKTFTFDASSGTAVTMTVNGFNANLKWTGSASNSWDTAATINWSNTASLPDQFYAGDNVTFDDTAGTANSVSVVGSVLPGSVTVSNTAVNFTFSGTGSIGGTSGLLKSGPGTLTLSSSNAFTGGTTLNGGVLNANAAHALGGGTLGISGGTLNATVANVLPGAAVAVSGGALNINAAQSPASVSLTNGVINATVAGALGTAAVAQNGGTLNASAAAAIGSGGLNVGGGVANITTAAGVVTGLTTVSGGTLNTDATATLGSGVTVSAGLLNIGNAAALGSGTLTLGGGGALDNTSGGPLTLSTNNVQKWNGSFTFLGSSNLNLGTGAVTLSASPTVTVSAGTLTVGGAISGTGFALTKNGTGMLTLTGANSYNAGTTISNGTLQIGNGSVNGTIGSGTYNIAGSNAMLRLNYASASAPTWANISGGGTLSLNTAVAANDTGWGTITTPLPSTFAGTLQIEAGRLYLRATNSLGNATSAVVLPGGQLGMDTITSLAQNLTISGTGYGDSGGRNGALRIGASANLSGGVTLAGPVSIGVDAGITPILSGVITGGSTANLTIGGGALETGTAAFSNANTYYGNTTVAYGGLKLSNSAALQNSTLTTAGITFDPAVSPSPFVFGGLSGSGNIPLTDGTNPVPLNVGNNNTNTVFSGALSSSGSLDKIGGGLLVLTGGNTYTGATAVNGGTLQIGNGGSAGSLSTSSAITTNATLALNRSDAIVQGTHFNGSGIGGTGGVVQMGPGAVTLNVSNGYSGPTTVSGGTLAISAAGDINATSGILINGPTARFVQNSSVAVTPAIALTQGVLDGSGAVGNVTVGNGSGGTVTNGSGGAATLTIGNLTFNGVAAMSLNISATGTPGVAVTNTLTTGSGAGEITVNASNASWANNTQYELVSYGALGGSGFSDFTEGTIANLTVRQHATLTNSSGYVGLYVSGDTPIWTGKANGSWTTTPVGAPYNWVLQVAGTGTEFLTGDSVVFDDTAGTAGTTHVAINNGNVSPSLMTFNNNAYAYTISGSNGIAAGSLVKNGAGLLTIETVNSFAGGTTISGGTLQLGTGLAGQDGVLASNVTNNAALVYYLNGNQTAGYSISGSGSLTMAGPAMLVLGAANTYSGPTFVNNGTVQLGNAAALQNSTVYLYSLGGILDLNGYNATLGGLTGDGNLAIAASTTLSVGNNNVTTTYTGALIGSGNLTKVGSGLLAVYGGNSYGGTTIVSNGTLDLGSAGNIGSTTSSLGVGNTVGAAAVLNISGGTVQTQGIQVALVNASGGAIEISGSTTVITANGSNGFTGGALRIGGASNSSTGAVTQSGGLVDLQNSYIMIGDASGTGSYTITGGTLLQGGSGDLRTLLGWSQSTLSQGALNVSGNAVVSLGGNLDIAHQGSAVVTVSQNGSLTTAGVTNFADVAGSAGTLNLNGGTLTTNGLAVSAGAATINFAGGMLAAGTSFTTTLPMNLNAGGAVFNGNGNLLTLSGQLSGPGGVTATGNGTVVLSVANSYFGGTKVNNGTLQLGDPGALGDPSGTLTANGGTLDMNGFSPTVGDLTGAAGVIASLSGPATLTVGTSNSTAFSGTIIDGVGPVSLTYNGTGKLTLLGNSTNTGTTTVNGGTLALGDGGTSGEILSPVAVNSGAVLLVNRSDIVDFTATISGSGSLVQAGSGTLILQGTNTYTGGTAVLNGTLVLTQNEAIADGTNLFVGTDLSAFGTVVPAQAGSPTASSAVAPVPEPGTLALAAALLGSAALYRRLRRR